MTRGQPRLGEGEPCPHCGATSGVAADSSRFTCLVCGGPRILVDPPIERPRREAQLLRQARQLDSRRLIWGVGAGVTSTVAVLSLLLAVLIFWLADLGALGALVLLVAVLAPVLAAFFSFRRWKKQSAEAQGCIEEAWRRAALEIIESQGGDMEPRQLAQTLHVPEDRATELLAYAQVEGLLEGSAAASPRFRVDTELGEPGEPSASANIEEAPATHRSRR